MSPSTHFSCPETSIDSSELRHSLGVLHIFPVWTGDKAGPLSELTFCSRRIKPLVGDDLCWCLSGSMEGGGTREVKNCSLVQVLNRQEMEMAGTFPGFLPDT